MIKKIEITNDDGTIEVFTSDGADPIVPIIEVPLNALIKIVEKK